MKKYNIFIAAILNSVVLFAQCKYGRVTGAQSPELQQTREFYDLSSEKIRSKFNQLVGLIKENDPNPTKHMDKDSKGAYFSTFTPKNQLSRVNIVKEILKKGDQGYIDLFLNKKPEAEKFFNDLLSPDTITMIAYMQSRYGGSNPLKYDSALFSKDLDKYAAEGYGRGSPTEAAITPTIFGLDLTSYAFLNNVINAIDSAKKDIANSVLQRIDKNQEKQLMEGILKIVNQLDMSLDEAIAQKQSMNLNFDSIMNNLQNLIQNGNTQILRDLADIEKKYQK
jgi:hypothetical protein